MKQPVIQIFATPRSSRRAGAQLQMLCQAFEARGAELILTAESRHPLTIDDRADKVCVFGGDGTLRYVIDAVRKLDRPVTVGVYPAGTVNLVAMERDYPRSPDKFADRFMGRHSFLQRIALINGVPLVACASIGPDSYAVAGVSTGLKHWIGRAAYIVAFLKVLICWPRLRLTVEHDGRLTECEAVYIAKGRYFAGRWTFAPNASLDDPLLHVVTLEHASRARMFRFIWAIGRGQRIDSLPGITCFTTSSILIRGDATTSVQVDGDVLGQLPASITMDPVPIRFA